MQSHILLNKPQGLTLSKQLPHLKAASALSKEKLSFAGRLDPMAEGLLLVLVGNENKNEENMKSYQRHINLNSCLA